MLRSRIGHATATPLMRVMNSRRLTGFVLKPGHGSTSLSERLDCIAAKLTHLRPLWVKHFGMVLPMSAHPPKVPSATVMSALCQNATLPHLHLGREFA